MFKILETAASFTRKLKLYFKQAFTKRFNKVSSEIEAKVKSALRTRLFNSPEIDSLFSGKLKIDFGLTDSMATQVIFDIIERVVDSVEVRPVFSNSDLVTINLIIPPLSKASFLSIRNATYISINKAGDQSPVPWLEWLLYRGTEVVVAGYAIAYGDYNRGYDSRTKEAIMVSLDSGSRNSTGEPFRVDPQFSGTENDNFITRAIQATMPDIERIISDSL